MEKFGERLRRLRLDRGILTAKELGNLIGISPSMISQYENGVFLPDIRTVRGVTNLQKICNFFGLSKEEQSQLLHEERLLKKLGVEAKQREEEFNTLFSTLLPEDQEMILRISRKFVG